MVSAQARREQVAFVCQGGLSKRRACGRLVFLSGPSYESCMPGRTPRDRGNEAVVIALPALRVSAHPHLPGTKARRWKPGVPSVLAPGQAAPSHASDPAARCHHARPHQAANHVWAYDVVFDACASGQQIRCLTIVDEFTHECLAIDVAGSIRSGRVIEVLGRLISLHGAPVYLRSDSGPEFVSQAILKWLTQSRIETALIDPGKPWQNGTNESFNGKFRDECLSLEWFRTRREAKIVIETWRQHYNGVRPHMSLNYLTPVEFKQQDRSTPIHQPRAISQE